MTNHEPAAVDRIPLARSVAYAVKGVPDVPAEHTKGLTLAPTEITLTYRSTTDSQLGRVHAYVKGWWMRNGERYPTEKPMGQHYYGGPDGWPEWLAEEARLHDPEPAVSVPPPAPRADALREAADFLRDAHFRDGLSVQEIGTAMRHWADREEQPSAGEQQNETPEAEAPAVCKGFVWIGQSFATCDRCGQPAWDHAGEEVPVEGAGPFDTRRTVRPWGPGQADAIRAKWAPAAGVRQDGAQQ